MADRLDCSYDRFIRTTDPDHPAVDAGELWRRMRERGDIYLSKYSGWYSVRDEAYYDEGELARQPDGTGLRRRARRSSGSRRRAISSGSPPTRPASAHYEANPTFIGPETRRNEIAASSAAPTKDLSISRTTFDWGLPVPGDPKHVM